MTGTLSELDWFHAVSADDVVTVVDNNVRVFNPNDGNQMASVEILRFGKPLKRSADIRRALTALEEHERLISGEDEDDVSDQPGETVDDDRFTELSMTVPSWSVIYAGEGPLQYKSHLTRNAPAVRLALALDIKSLQEWFMGEERTPPGDLTVTSSFLQFVDRPSQSLLRDSMTLFVDNVISDAGVKNSFPLAVGNTPVTLTVVRKGDATTRRRLNFVLRPGWLDAKSAPVERTLLVGVPHESSGVKLDKGGATAGTEAMPLRLLKVDPPTEAEGCYLDMVADTTTGLTTNTLLTCTISPDFGPNVLLLLTI